MTNSSNRRKLKSRKGSASALIVLMVVLLAVFGAMALTSAAANLRLATRHADWSREFYAYDAQAERLVAQLDATARKAAAENQSTASLCEYVKAIRMEGVHAIDCVLTGDRLVVDATIGNPEQRGILLTASLPAEIPASGSGTGLQLMRWSQFQKAFDYGNEPGGIWTGK